jgi:hypothetical protein
MPTLLFGLRLPRGLVIGECACYDGLVACGKETDPRVAAESPDRCLGRMDALYRRHDGVLAFGGRPEPPPSADAPDALRRHPVVPKFL